MSLEPREHSSVKDILYKDARSLRDLGNNSPGISLPRGAMRDLGVLDADGVDTNTDVPIAIYSDGHISVDIPLDA